MGNAGFGTCGASGGESRGAQLFQNPTWKADKVNISTMSLIVSSEVHMAGNLHVWSSVTENMLWEHSLELLPTYNDFLGSVQPPIKRYLSFLSLVTHSVYLSALSVTVLGDLPCEEAEQVFWFCFFSAMSLVLYGIVLLLCM